MQRALLAQRARGARACVRAACRLTLIILRRDEVHRRPAEARAAGDDGRVHAAAIHARAAECRQQRRVHVEHASFVRAHHGFGHQLEVARQDDQVDIARLKRREQHGRLRRRRAGL